MQISMVIPDESETNMLLLFVMYVLEGPTSAAIWVVNPSASVSQLAPIPLPDV